MVIQETFPVFIYCMNKFFCIVALFVTVNSNAQDQHVADSLNSIYLDDMVNFFKHLDSSNLSEIDKAQVQYKKVKSFVREHPSNNYSALFISWGKYFNSLQIDTLTSLLDSSLADKIQVSIADQKKRSLLIPGSVFPPLILKDSLNRELNIENMKGKLVLLNIWSAVCEPCRKEMPELVDIYNRYKDKGLVVIGISVDDDKQKWLKAIADDHQPWPQYCELLVWMYTSMFTKWSIGEIPYNFLIGTDGKLIDKQIPIQRMEKYIRDNL